MSTLTARQRFRDAVWDADDLRPLEKLVALAFEKYAGHGTEFVWVSGDELRRVTQLSRDAANRALRGLEDKGWLVLVERPRQHRTGRYALRVPGQHSASRNATASRNGESQVSVPPDVRSVPSDVASVTGGGSEPRPEPRTEPRPNTLPLPLGERGASTMFDATLALINAAFAARGQTPMDSDEEAEAILMLARGHDWQSIVDDLLPDDGPV